MTDRILSEPRLSECGVVYRAYRACAMEMRQCVTLFSEEHVSLAEKDHTFRNHASWPYCFIPGQGFLLKPSCGVVLRKENIRTVPTTAFVDHRPDPLFVFEQRFHQTLCSLARLILSCKPEDTDKRHKLLHFFSPDEFASEMPPVPTPAVLGLRLVPAGISPTTYFYERFTHAFPNFDIVITGSKDVEAKASIIVQVTNLLLEDLTARKAKPIGKTWLDYAKQIRILRAADTKIRYPPPDASYPNDIICVAKEMGIQQKLIWITDWHFTILIKW